MFFTGGEDCLFNAGCFQYLTLASPSSPGLLNVSIDCVCIQFSDMTRQDSFSPELAVSALCLTEERGEAHYNYQTGSVTQAQSHRLSYRLVNTRDKTDEAGLSNQSTVNVRLCLGLYSFLPLEILWC